MNRQLGCDFRLGEFVEQLDVAASVGTEEQDRPPAALRVRETPIGVTAVFVVA